LQAWHLTCLAKGWCGPEDLEAAAHWWRKAADQGHTKAQHEVGVCLSSGTGVPKDAAAAAPADGRTRSSSLNFIFEFVGAGGCRQDSLP